MQLPVGQHEQQPLAHRLRLLAAAAEQDGGLELFELLGWSPAARSHASGLAVGHEPVKPHGRYGTNVTAAPVISSSPVTTCVVDPSAVPLKPGCLPPTAIAIRPGSTRT